MKINSGLTRRETEAHYLLPCQRAFNSVIALDWVGRGILELRRFLRWRTFHFGKVMAYCDSCCAWPHVHSLDRRYYRLGSASHTVGASAGSPSGPEEPGATTL